MLNCARVLLLILVAAFCRVAWADQIVPSDRLEIGLQVRT